MNRLQLTYGYAPDGFYWPESPSKRAEYLQVKRGHPAVAEAVYQCQPGALEGEIFLEKDFRYYTAPKRLMDGIDSNMNFVSQSDMILQVWDTAFSAQTDADYSVCLTAMLTSCNRMHPNNPEDDFTTSDDEFHYDVHLLDVVRERIDFGDLLPMSEAQYHKWRPTSILIEKKASGQSLLQVLDQKGLPVVPVDPGIHSKRARAVFGVKAGSAQGWVQLHRVFFPSEAIWLEDFKTELKNFSGNGDAHDDQVDAFVHLLNYAILQGAESPALPTNAKIEKFINSEEPFETLEQALFSDLEGPEDLPICRNCINFNKKKSWCMIHNRKVTIFDSCPDFTATKPEEPY